MVLAVGKGIDRAHGKSDVRPRVRMSLTCNMLTEGMDRVMVVGPEESVIWRRLALSFHLLCGWKLPTSHCMVLAVGKGMDRAHGKSDVRPRVRMPLMWNTLTNGMDRVIEVETEDR